MLTSNLLLEPPSNKKEVEILNQFNQALNADKAMICLPDGNQFEVPLTILPCLKAMVDTLINGQAVSLIPLHKELTTQQAADLLNVSRPYLVKLLESGKIPFNTVGKHRRILMEHLLKYRDMRDNNRRKRLQDLTDMSQELGLYD